MYMYIYKYVAVCVYTLPTLVTCGDIICPVLVHCDV